MMKIEDFEKVDIRIGTVCEAEVPQWSHWVMRLVVDFGDRIGKKTVFSGISKFYRAEDLVGKQFPFVVNLEPKKIGPEKELSEAMMLMAQNGEEDDEETPPTFLVLQERVSNGAKVR